MAIVLLGRLPSIVAHVLAAPFESWSAYECDNGSQNLTRLSKYLDGDEVQINLLRHAEAAHYHDCEMMSLILDVGYAWELRQAGCAEFQTQYAAPGSLITLGPNDVHSIPRSRDGSRSLSLCVFSRQSDWAAWYTTHGHALATAEARALHGRAVRCLRRWAPLVGPLLATPS